ncbi:MAG: chemotaxis protein CheW [Thermodesulfobacteriota bacterium]
MSDNSNDEMLALFIEESKEHLEVVEPALLTMEEKGDETDAETVNTVFRAIHSIKGSAGFFGLKNITELSHTMENLMAKVRDGSTSTTPELINILLNGLDKLEGMVEDVGTSDDVDVSVEIANIEALISGETEKTPHSQSEEGAAESETSQKDPHNFPWGLEEYEEALRATAANGHHLYSLTIPLPAKTAARKKTITEQKNFLSSIGLIVASKPDIESVKAIKELSAKKTESFTLLLSTILEESLLVESAGLTEDNVTTVDMSEEIVPEKKDHDEGDNKAQAPSPSKNNNDKEETAKKDKTSAAGTEKPQSIKKKDSGKMSPSTETVRVRVDLLDKIMALAGEIVLGRNQLLRQYAGRKNNGILIDHSQRVTELQESVMKTRLQPVGAVFSKFKRIVRDMARKVDKKINLVVEGEDVELDRSIIEVLSDPLTHMIRNSVDHAIESPDERLKHGKADTGTINLRASHQGGLVVIEIEDDGRGIDSVMIRDKALTKGIISDDDAKRMSDKELVNLIFHPGFSTVTEVSELSGRGVGMDVVKRSFEKLGSTIDLQSTPGAGTLFTVRLPLTLAILPSIIVTVGANTFAIPQVDITEIVRIREKDLGKQLEYIEGQSVFRLRGKLLPVISLTRIFEMSSSGQDAESTADLRLEDLREPSDEEAGSKAIRRLIVMRYGANHIGLLVDTVLDPEEIVVKPMPHLVRDCKIFASATIMGDGHVAMILNLGGIIEKAGFRFESFEKETLQYEEEERKKAMQESQSILIVKNPADEHFGISLSMISRIEKVRADEVTLLAGKRFINFRGKSIELVSVENFINANHRQTLSGDIYVIIPNTRGQIVGIVAEEIVDVIDISLEMDEGAIDSPVVIGSTIIEKKMTLMIDVYTLLEEALTGGSLSKSAANGSHEIRILLVEDTPFFQNLEERYFTSAGFKVTIASDGGKGLEMLQASPEAFDIVVSDIEMPVMNGYELVNAIRNSESLAHLPVMALTSLNTEENRRCGIEAGFDAYEVKVDKDSLLNRVLELVQSNTNGEATKGADGQKRAV